MDWDIVAPMITAIVFIVTTGGVLILRPLSKRVAELLEVMIDERRGPRRAHDISRLTSIAESLDQRLSVLEERQDFTDSLLAAGGARPTLPGRATREPT